MSSDPEGSHRGWELPIPERLQYASDEFASHHTILRACDICAHMCMFIDGCYMCVEVYVVYTHNHKYTHTHIHIHHTTSTRPGLQRTVPPGLGKKDWWKASVGQGPQGGGSDGGAGGARRMVPGGWCSYKAENLDCKKFGASRRKSLTNFLWSAVAPTVTWMQESHQRLIKPRLNNFIISQCARNFS